MSGILPPYYFAPALSFDVGRQIIGAGIAELLGNQFILT
jgi:hypothetical protein